MKRALKQPPLIIIMDVVFIFLFALILKPSEKNIEVILPENQNPRYVLIVTVSKKSHLITKYYNELTNNWDSIENFKEYKNIFNNYKYRTFSYNCLFIKKNRAIYEKLPKIETDKKIYTIIYGNLYYELLHVFYEGAFKDKQSFNIKILPDGMIEYK